MRKILAAAIATTMIAAASVAATTAPANAGNFSVHIGGWSHGGWGPGWHPGGWGYNAYAPVHVVPVTPTYHVGGGLTPHQQWCVGNFKTYDLNTNLYFYAIGKQKPCVSPY